MDLSLGILVCLAGMGLAYLIIRASGWMPVIVLLACCVSARAAYYGCAVAVDGAAQLDLEQPTGGLLARISPGHARSINMELSGMPASGSMSVYLTSGHVFQGSLPYTTSTSTSANYGVWVWDSSPPQYTTLVLGSGISTTNYVLSASRTNLSQQVLNRQTIIFSNGVPVYTNSQIINPGQTWTISYTNVGSAGTLQFSDYVMNSDGQWSFVGTAGGITDGWSAYAPTNAWVSANQTLTQGSGNVGGTNLTNPADVSTLLSGQGMQTTALILSNALDTQRIVNELENVRTNSTGSGGLGTWNTNGFDATAYGQEASNYLGGLVFTNYTGGVDTSGTPSLWNFYMRTNIGGAATWVSFDPRKQQFWTFAPYVRAVVLFIFCVWMQMWTFALLKESYETLLHTPGSGHGLVASLVRVVVVGMAGLAFLIGVIGAACVALWGIVWSFSPGSGVLPWAWDFFSSFAPAWADHIREAIALVDAWVPIGEMLVIWLAALTCRTVVNAAVFFGAVMIRFGI